MSQAKKVDTKPTAITLKSETGLLNNQFFGNGSPNPR
jgi:hypothetical protein